MLEVEATAPTIKVDPKNVAAFGGDVSMAYILHFLIEVSDPHHTGTFTPVIMTQNQIAKLTGLNRDTIQRKINQLRVAGYLDWTAKNPGNPTAYTPRVNLLVN